MIPINTQCACPGDILTYTCTAVGGGTTLWGGTAFKCGRSNEIALRHSRFASGGINGTCNNGAILGQNIGVQDNNCFISQLNITVDAEFNNKTVYCVHDSVTNSSLTIGTAILRVISGIILVRYISYKLSINNFELELLILISCKSLLNTK